MANIIDSYSETNQNSFSKTATTNFVGQSFTGNGSTLGSAQLYISKLGSPTGNANAKIYAHSGTFGTSSIPTGSALATSDNFDVSTLTTSFQLITFNFSGGNQIALGNGTHYVLTLEYTGGAYISDAVKVGFDTTSPTHGGNDSFTSDATTWFSEAFDLCFYVYDNASATTTSTSSTSSSTSISTSSTSQSTSTSISTSTSSTSTSTTVSITTSTSSTSSSISTSSTSQSTSISTSSTSSSISISTSLSTSSTSSSTSVSTSISTSSTSTSVSSTSSSTSSTTTMIPDPQYWPFATIKLRTR